MIKITARPRIPPTLNSGAVQAIKEALEHASLSGVGIKSSDFDSSLWRKEDVLTPLCEMHNGKCCYCERKRNMKRESDVEHYRPKAEITEAVTHPGYWWLAYDWSNYLFSCKICNQSHKKNHFPLINNSRALGPGDDITNETPLLINPVEDNPECYISFEWSIAYGLFVKAVGIDIDGRGKATIEITGINEGDIPKERAELVAGLDEIATTMKLAIRKMSDNHIGRMAEIIMNETSADRSFAGFKRAFFRAWGLGAYIAKD